MTGPASLPSRFVKMSGAGSDFVMFLGRATGAPGEAEAIRRVCDRRTGVGADGVLFVQKDGTEAVAEYFNADGSPARFCANGTSCAARLASGALGLGNEFIVITGWGRVGARVVPGGRVTLSLPEPVRSGRKLSTLGLGEGVIAAEAAEIYVGVPHLVDARYLQRETVYWGSLLGCVEMIASGTTTISDGYFFQEATAEAFDRAGMRALVAQGVLDLPAPGVPDPRENLKAGKRFIEKWLHVSDRIRPGLFCHSLTTCSESTLRGAMEISEEFSLPLQIHLSETSQDVDDVCSNTGRRPAFYLDDIGVANNHLIAVHAVHLDEPELHLLAERKTRIVHVPEINMKLASGNHDR